jgi:hypothetical protein
MWRLCKCPIGGLYWTKQGVETVKCPIGGLYWTKQGVETVKCPIGDLYWTKQGMRTQEVSDRRSLLDKTRYENEGSVR